MNNLENLSIAELQKRSDFLVNDKNQTFPDVLEEISQIREILERRSFKVVAKK